MDNHDQTKLEIAAAAGEVALSLACDGNDISRIVSRAFTEFAERIRERVEENKLDRWGNPKDGSRLIYCCFPDCGCDGARLCMAENGAHDGALMLNLEKRSGQLKEV